MLLQLLIFGHGYVTICQPLPLPYGAGSESEISGDLNEAECTLGAGQYGRLTLHLIQFDSLIAPW